MGLFSFLSFLVKWICFTVGCVFHSCGLALVLEQGVCVCMHVYATEWGVGSWSMVVLTDLGDVASRTGQQLTVLRIRVTCSAPSALRSDDILSLMSKVTMTISELHRAINQLPSPGHSNRKDYVMNRRGRPLVIEQGELQSVCSPSLLKERPLNPHRPPVAMQTNTRPPHTFLIL